MKSILAIAIAVLALASSTQAQVQLSFADCQLNGVYDLTTTSAALTSAANPCSNVAYRLSLEGTLAQPLTAPSKLTIEGHSLGRRIYGEEKDLCALLAAQGTPCPLPAGPVSLELDLQWSFVLGNWNTKYMFHGSNGNGNVAFCKRATTLVTNCAAV